MDFSIIVMDFLSISAARNVHDPSTIAMDRYALVPALSSRDQAGSLLLFALSVPILLDVLSLVQCKLTTLISLIH